jgi:transposase
MQYIAFDVHKKYTWARVEDPSAGVVRQERIGHRPGAVGAFLSECEAGSPVAVETVGNWYWVVDEIERAGCAPKLVNARLAKLMMGQVNKTDKLDARGLNLLQRSGTLPTVWIPPAPVRDARELPRLRMTLVGQRTQLKNRVHATLDKYGITPPQVSDLFGKAGREWLGKAMAQLPPNTTHATAVVLEHLDGLERAITELDERIDQVFAPTPENELLRTLPGVGRILAVVIAAEMGDKGRFPSAERFASYAGTVPRVHASGGKHYGGRVRTDTNPYLKWAFVEAANAALLQGERYGHVRRLYDRLRARRGHGKAIVAVARHLAEAAYWVLTKQQPYQEPRRSVQG